MVLEYLRHSNVWLAAQRHSRWRELRHEAKASRYPKKSPSSVRWWQTSNHEVIISAQTSSIAEVLQTKLNRDEKHRASWSPRSRPVT